MRRIFKFIAILLVSNSVFAQDRSNIYTNLLNPFLHDPSQAGSDDRIYSIFNMRNMVNGIEGMPRSYNFGLHAPLNNGVGLGVKVLAQTSGVFQTMNAEGVYSKMVTLKANHTLRFGLSVGMVQNSIRSELLNGQVDLSDQTLLSNDLNKILISTGAGINYRFDKKVELGVSFPMLVTGLNPINPMMIANFNWNIYVGKAQSWKVKPGIHYYYLTNNSPSMADLLLGTSWNETFTLTGGYRTNGSIIGMAGLNFKSFSVNYAYYHHAAGLEKLAPAQHELALSFSFNRPTNSKVNREKNSEQIIDDEIEKLTSRLNNIMKMEKANPGVINVKYEMERLNKDLDKVLSTYSITNNVQLQKIKKLQETIDLFIAVNSK